MGTIAILDPGFPSYDYESALFKSQGYDLLIPEVPAKPVEERLADAKGSEGILVRGTRVGAGEMDLLRGLRAIVRYGVGYDNIDLKAAKERGIRVANVRGYANHSVSDHALGLMFACIRDLGSFPYGNRFPEFGKPVRSELFELHDKTLGIIGIGRIGSCFSRKASALFADTLACDPYKDETYIKSFGARKTALLEVLEKSHVISLHCNLTPETRHILNECAFETMKMKPVIINTARGPVIKESDLVTALENRQVHSAGLDVFENEPVGPAQKELLDHPRVVATPHIAWYSQSSIRELQKKAADHMVGLLKGQPVADELNAEP
jgi:D-3-phosphoglycerate dehydrogenase